VLLGCLENEARYFLRSRDVNRAMVETMARALAGGRADRVLQALPEDPYDALDRLFAAAIWLEPALATVERFAELGRHLYYYHFTRVSPGARRTGDLAKHSAEIRYVFGTLSSDAPGTGSITVLGTPAAATTMTVAHLNPAQGFQDTHGSSGSMFRTTRRLMLPS